MLTCRADSHTARETLIMGLHLPPVPRTRAVSLSPRTGNTARHAPATEEPRDAKANDEFL